MLPFPDGAPMKSNPECMLCCFRQALNTARLITEDTEIQRRVLAGVADYVQGASLDQTPAALSQPVYDIARAVTGAADLYERQKREGNRRALDILPRVEALVAGAADPLAAAVQAAAAGNVIDLGIGQPFDIERDVLAAMRQPLALNAVGEFRAELRPGRRLLYLGDNAGEIVFDTLLVREILKTGARVTFAVKSGPIINDALLRDAEEVGLTRLTRVIETGAADIGINWANVSPAFRAAVAEADAILGKGHGNFETRAGYPANFYFLLKAKCVIVAAELGVPLGAVVFKHQPRA